MSKNLVGVTIDKVQKYLYYTLNNLAQESQSDSGTLQGVIQASEFVSNEFMEEVKKSVGQEDDIELVACSGKYIFETTQNETAILKKLDELFCRYYQEFEGQLILRYVCLPWDSPTIQQEKGADEKLKKINTVSYQLKKSQPFSQILERNQAMLFDNYSETTSCAKRETPAKESYPFFVKNINELSFNDDTLNQNHFRIAVIKADLDGMGELFKHLDTYEAYTKISTLLSDYISLDKLHEHAEQVSQALQIEKHVKPAGKPLEFKMYPLYIAGDDIFFAVRVEHLLSGIEVCKKILWNLNNEITRFAQQLGTEMPKLSFSIGTEITFNREPIRYYHERVNHQLDNIAKKQEIYIEREGYVLRKYNKENEKKEQADENQCQINQINKSEVATLKWAMNNSVFLEVLIDGDKERSHGIQAMNPECFSLFLFTQEMYHLSQAIAVLDKPEDQYYSSRFLHSLLEKIKDASQKTNPRRYENNIIYHLMPRTWSNRNSPLQVSEFKLLMPLVEQISKHQHTSGPKAKFLDFSEPTIYKFKTYVELALLFTDSRFNIIICGKTDENKSKQLTQKGTTILINRSMAHLYYKSLSVKRNSKLKDVFVKQENYAPEPEKNVRVYRLLKISTSMFYRIKQLEQAKNGKNNDEVNRKICQMLEATNSFTKNQILEEERERKEAHQAPPGLFLDQSKLRTLLNHEVWTTDYIDSLLLLYKLNELLIEFKVAIK